MPVLYVGIFAINKANWERFVVLNIFSTFFRLPVVLMSAHVIQFYWRIVFRVTLFSMYNIPTNQVCKIYTAIMQAPLNIFCFSLRTLQPTIGSNLLIKQSNTSSSVILYTLHTINFILFMQPIVGPLCIQAANSSYYYLS